jgi:uncharacterized protein (TIGR02147 family)
MNEIYTFLDYREYLKEYYTTQRECNPNFSYRYFARLAGFKGQSFLRMVMDGDRGLKPDSIAKFATALKLKKKEKTYFEALVFYNQAKTEKDKDYYFDRLMGLRPPQSMQGLEKDSFEYITKDYYVIIREMVAVPSFMEDVEWIRSQFYPPLKPKQVTDAIETLVRLGLLKRDTDGKLEHSSALLKSLPEADSIEVFNYHRTVLSKAKDSILNVLPEFRETVSMTIPMSVKDLQKVKDAIRGCQESIANIVNSSANDSDEVFQVNVQMFPVTKMSKEKKK